MPLAVHGPTFYQSDRPVFLKAVTFGPFNPEAPLDPVSEFPRIRRAGFNAVRTFELPDQTFLDAAEKSGLLVIPTLSWGSGTNFIADPTHLYQAIEKATGWLQNHHQHPALAAFLVGNEIPAPLVRLMEPVKVRDALDHLITELRKTAPKVPFGYANYPTTEYLEPLTADFTAVNLYLEDTEKLSAYLARLPHLAGSRPVLITEFGLDTAYHGESAQAELLANAFQLTRDAGLGGLTVFSWSDRWFTNQEEVTQWSFGLTTRAGRDKKAVKVLTDLVPQLTGPPKTDQPLRFSILICTRNGAHHLPACLQSCEQLAYTDHEILVIDDGSTDETPIVATGFSEKLPNLKVISIPPSGLSAARNIAAEAATGEILAYLDDDSRPSPDWLNWLAHTFQTTGCSAAGGPNIAPKPKTVDQAIVNAAPGHASHVMLDDQLAEHLPGCNFAVKRSAFHDIGGFDPQFTTAGDDVDFCWRLRERGYELRFSPQAWVYHERRETPAAYLAQQEGYGRAEALLFQKHPARFQKDPSEGIRWEGWIYQGPPVSVQPGDVIYTGLAGCAPFQFLQAPQASPLILPAPFQSRENQAKLHELVTRQPIARAAAREAAGGPPATSFSPPADPPQSPGNQTLSAVVPSEALPALLAESAPIEDPLFDYQHRDFPLRFISATEHTATQPRRVWLKISATPDVIAQFLQTAPASLSEPFQPLFSHRENH